MKSLHNFMVIMKYRSSPSEVLLGKGALKIYIKFTENIHAEVRSVISIKLLWNFIEITLRHGCSPLNLLHIFRIPFYRKTYGGLFLQAPNDNVQELFYFIVAVCRNTFKTLYESVSKGTQSKSLRSYFYHRHSQKNQILYVFPNLLLKNH